MWVAGNGVGRPSAGAGERWGKVLVRVVVGRLGTWGMGIGGRLAGCMGVLEGRGMNVGGRWWNVGRTLRRERWFGTSSQRSGNVGNHGVGPTFGQRSGNVQAMFRQSPLQYADIHWCKCGGVRGRHLVAAVDGRRGMFPFCAFSPGNRH